MISALFAAMATVSTALAAKLTAAGISSAVVIYKATRKAKK